MPVLLIFGGAAPSDAPAWPDIKESERTNVNRDHNCTGWKWRCRVPTQPCLATLFLSGQGPGATGEVGERGLLADNGGKGNEGGEVGGGGTKKKSKLGLALGI